MTDKNAVAYRNPTHPLVAVGVNVDLMTALLSTHSIRAIRVARSLRLAPFPSTAVSIYLLLERRRLHARIYLAGYQDLLLGWRRDVAHAFFSPPAQRDIFRRHEGGR